MFSADMDLIQIIQTGARAVMEGGMSASVLLSLALLLAVSLGRKILSAKFPILKTDIGAVTFTFALSVLAGMANAAVAGSALSWSLFAGSIQIAWLAMGGFATIKKLIVPGLAIIKAKFPKLSFLWDALGALFGAAGYQAIETAVKKGEQAVTKSPGKGVKGVLGEPKKFPGVKGAKSATRSRP